MEPHLQHTQGNHYDDPNTLNAGAGAGAATHHTGNDEDEHHGEKKSMIKKVNEKAKKLNNTIRKRGHGHGGDHAVYDSAKVGLPRGNLERPSVMAEDRVGRSDVAEPEAKHGAPPPVSAGPNGSNWDGYPHGQEVNPKQWRGKIGQSTGMEEDSRTHQEKLRGSMGKSTGMVKDPNDPKDPSLAGSDPTNYETKVSDPTHTGTTHQEELRGSMGKSTGMVKDPNDPKGPSLAGSDPSNYETKVSDPTHTGGKVAGLSQKFDKMGIHESDPKSFDPNHPENQPRETLTGNPSSRSSSYVEKISSSASAIVDKATDVVTSKLGYSGKVPSNEPHETVTKPHETATKPVSVTGKVTETLAPVYSKVVDAGSSVISKVQGSVSRRPSVEGATTVEKGKEGDKGATVKEYVVETLRPGDDDKALSEVITNAFHRGKHEETEKKAGEDIPAPVGTVTESEAVRQQLESDPDHDHDHDHSNNVVAGRGVADRLKDAVGSWFGGKGNAPEGTGGTSYVTDEGLSSTKPTPTENRDGGK